METHHSVNRVRWAVFGTEKLQETHLEISTGLVCLFCGRGVCLWQRTRPLSPVAGYQVFHPESLVMATYPLVITPSWEEARSMSP